MTRIGNLRAAEAAYRRQVIAAGSAIATRRTFSPRLVRWFWLALVGVSVATVADISIGATGLVHAVETAWRNW